MARKPTPPAQSVLDDEFEANLVAKGHTRALRDPKGDAVKDALDTFWTKHQRSPCVEELSREVGVDCRRTLRRLTKEGQVLVKRTKGKVEYAVKAGG